MYDSKLIIKQKRFKGEDGYKTFSIRIKESIADEIDNIAKSCARSRNEVISIFLQYGSENCVVEESYE